MKYFLLPLFLLALASCTPTKEEGAPPLIVCTTGMLGDAVAEMTSGCEVRTLMGPGTDPHLFKPTKESLDLLQRADLVVANGLHLEGRMQDILEKLQRQKPVIFAAQGIDASALRYEDALGKVPDPHVWFDVALWKEAVSHLDLELAKVIEVCRDSARSNRYHQALDTLHHWVRREISKIPENQRVLITAHDAFSYFGAAYGMEVVALQGISTAAEYGVRDVTDMIDLITKRQIKAIFEESSISPRSVEALTAGCARAGFAVSRGGTLYSDALGSRDSGAHTYIGMVRHNVTTIQRALQ